MCKNSLERTLSERESVSTKPVQLRYTRLLHLKDEFTMEEIFDVILLPTGNFHAELETYCTHRPPEENFHLNEELWIGHLPYGVSSESVFDACDAPGWNFHPARQYGMRYALCRSVAPPNEAYYRWDHDQIIGTTVLLSRFIRPTTLGTSLSARLYFKDCESQTIVPGPTQSNCSHA